MVHSGKEIITDFVSGFAGGAACVYCGQPLDTVKVKLQTFPSMYNGTIDCFQQTLKAEGLQGLYKGTIPALVCNISENAVLFPARGLMEKFVGYVSNQQVSNLSDFQRACAGSLASIFSSLVVCPTELVKCRMQAMKELRESGKVQMKPMGPWGVLRHMIKTEGIRSPFSGLTSTWAREMPGYLLFFFGYEKTRTLLTPQGKTKDDLGILATMFAGGTAGLCLWVGIFPIDVVKSRIQVLSAAGKQYGFMKTLTTIVRTEGSAVVKAGALLLNATCFFMSFKLKRSSNLVRFQSAEKSDAAASQQLAQVDRVSTLGIRALYSGLLPTVIRTYPANGALMLTMEWTRQWFGNQLEIYY